MPQLNLEVISMENLGALLQTIIACEAHNQFWCTHTCDWWPFNLIIGSFYFSEVLLRNNLVNMALSTMTRTCMTYTKQENQTHYLQGKIWQSATQMKQYLTNETYHMRMKMQGTHTFTLTGLLKTESEKGSTRCMCKHTLAHEFFHIVVLWLRLMDNVVYMDLF